MEEQYVIIVEADSQTADKQKPQILYAQKSSSEMARARGNVWTHNPGIIPQREMVSFPRPVTEYPIETGSLNLPDPSFPRSWIDEGGLMATGNNTLAVSGNSMNSINGLLIEDVLTFNPSSAQGDDQKVVNIFYFCNYMRNQFNLDSRMSELIAFNHFL